MGLAKTYYGKPVNKHFFVFWSKENNARISYKKLAYGASFRSTKRFLRKFGVFDLYMTKKVSIASIFSKFHRKVELDFLYEHDIKKAKSENILYLKKNKSYRGIRHIQHLPVRGQRTKTNAQTMKNQRRGYSVQFTLKEKKGKGNIGRKKK